MSILLEPAQNSPQNKLREVYNRHSSAVNRHSGGRYALFSAFDTTDIRLNKSRRKSSDRPPENAPRVYGSVARVLIPDLWGLIDLNGKYIRGPEKFPSIRFWWLQLP
jgi:hypothetical protein